MSYIKDALTRLWYHVVLHDNAVLEEAKEYADSKSVNIPDAGSATQPVYFANGVPVTTTGKMIKSGTGTNAEIFNDATKASGYASHAEGVNTEATQQASHAEGQVTHATGQASHSEGMGTTASGTAAHAEGYTAVASGNYSHAEGLYTIAASDGQHAEGSYNLEDSAERYLHIVGNGNNKGRSNAYTLDWDGNAWFAGDVYVGGTSQDDATAVLTANDITSIVEAVKAQIGHTIVSATAPDTTNSNVIWVNTSDSIARYHNGTEWIALGAVWK